MNVDVDANSLHIFAETYSSYENFKCLLFIKCSFLNPGGGGVVPYKIDGGARRKNFERTPLKSTRILFYRCFLKFFFTPAKRF